MCVYFYRIIIQNDEAKTNTAIDYATIQSRSLEHQQTTFVPTSFSFAQAKSRKRLVKMHDLVWPISLCVSVCNTLSRTRFDIRTHEPPCK